jgi:hypothetical protein
MLNTRSFPSVAFTFPFSIPFIEIRATARPSNFPCRD